MVRRVIQKERRRAAMVEAGPDILTLVQWAASYLNMAPLGLLASRPALPQDLQQLALIPIVPPMRPALPAATAPTPPSVPPSRTSQPVARMARPGCTAADESGVVLYHLQGLAEGKRGFGVLATDIQRLERAALGAEGMKDLKTAERLRAFKERLPQVRSQEEAARAEEELRPVADVAWELGRRCGGHDVTPVLRERAKALAERVARGELTREQAARDLKEGSLNADA